VKAVSPTGNRCGSRLPSRNWRLWIVERLDTARSEFIQPDSASPSGQRGAPLLKKCPDFNHHRPYNANLSVAGRRVLHRPPCPFWAG
jgi:hypothetical protein